MIEKNRPTRNLRNNIWLKRLSRISAWALLAAVIILVISGWGITQTGVIHHITFGLIDRALANSIHRNTNVPLAAFFLIHVLTNIKLMTYRGSRFQAGFVNIILIVIGAGLMAIVIYMEYFRLGG